GVETQRQWSDPAYRPYHTVSAGPLLPRDPLGPSIDKAWHVARSPDSLVRQAFAYFLGCVGDCP
ncbi:MAG TPA: hypothetical protein VM537_08015, partial [Anaerolineae bacterium]|nr:hypothetical protein [Anaerolineae bacterium]